MNMHLVKRTFKIEKKIDVACEKIIQEGLGESDGVLAVDAGLSGKKVKVEYDLYQIQFPIIEKTLEDMGLKLSSNWLHALQHNWVRFSEENEIANLEHTPHCCNKSPR